MFQVVKSDDKKGLQCHVPIDHGLHRPIPDAQVQGSGISAWGPSDYLQALEQLAEQMGMPLGACARRYGTLSLPKPSATGWQFHPALGFSKA